MHKGAATSSPAFPTAKIVCNGSSVNLNVRSGGGDNNNNNKATAGGGSGGDVARLRRLYRPVVADEYRHEIANNYKDFQRMKYNRYRRKTFKRLSYADRNFEPVQRQRLQIPCLVFPR